MPYKNIELRCETDRNYRQREDVKNKTYTRSKSNLMNKRQAVNDFKMLSGCVICGYNKASEALDFHHRDPATKLYSVQALAKNYGMNTELWTEIAKCVVLCANCHREVHAGLASIPDGKGDALE